MSDHHHNNPHVSGDESSPQGQHGFTSRGLERDLWRAQHPNHPGSSSGSSEVFAADSSDSGGAVPPVSPGPESQTSEQHGVDLNKEIVGPVDFHLALSREKSTQQPVDQDADVNRSEGDKSLSLGKEVASPPALFTFQILGLSDSDTSSLEWLSICKTPVREESSSCPSSGECQVYGSGESRRDDEAAASDQTVPPEESQHQGCTPEIAVNILEKFGLGKEDLEGLLSYPEDQITSDNLPLILSEIRLQKEKLASELQPPSSPNMDEPGEEMDCGQTSECVLVGDESGGTSESELGTHCTSSFHKEPQQISAPEAKSSSCISSCDLMGSVSSVGSVRSPVSSPRSDPTEQQPSRSNPTSKEPLAPSSVVNTDTNTTHVEAEAEKLLSSKEQEPYCPLISKTKPSDGKTYEEKFNSDSCKTKRHNPDVADHLSNKRQRACLLEEEKAEQLGEKEAEASKQPSQHQKAEEQSRFSVPPVLSKYPSLLSGQPGAKAAVCSGPPPQAKMNDYASLPPVKFPHVCSLCNIIYPTFKDWLPHQNSTCHTESCKRLRKRYPHWDGNVDHLKRDPEKPIPSTHKNNKSTILGENIQISVSSISDDKPQRCCAIKDRCLIKIPCVVDDETTPPAPSKEKITPPQDAFSNHQSHSISNDIQSLCWKDDGQWFTPVRSWETQSVSGGGQVTQRDGWMHQEPSGFPPQQQIRPPHSPFPFHQSFMGSHVRPPYWRGNETSFTPWWSWKSQSASAGSKVMKNKYYWQAEKKTVKAAASTAAAGRPVPTPETCKDPQTSRTDAETTETSKTLLGNEEKPFKEQPGVDVEETPPASSEQMTKKQ